MILFKTFVGIPDDFMYYHGIKNIITLNLCSSYYGYKELINLIPDQTLDGIPFDEGQFDYAYSNYVVNHTPSFIDLMNIVLPVYNDPDIVVEILVAHSPFRDCIYEGIAKIIQQRYGYNSYTINDVEDFFYVKDDSTFSIPGLILLNRDLERYAMVVGSATGEIYQDE